MKQELSKYNQNDIVDCATAAKLLCLTVSSVRYETHIKRIPHIKIGRRVRYCIADLQEWLNANKKGGVHEK